MGGREKVEGEQWTPVRIDSMFHIERIEEKYVGDRRAIVPIVQQMIHYQGSKKPQYTYNES